VSTKVSARTLEALAAAAAGALFRAEITFTWWQETGPGDNPHTATRSGKTLLSNDWIRLRPDDGTGRRRAVLTKAGRELLAAHTETRQ
jgi:hypothetical protein